jgi:hypothetical protein
MWGFWVWSEVGVLIHPTSVLRDSDQDSGLASPFLESYCPQTIPSQTLLYGREHCHADRDNHHHLTSLLPSTVCNGSKCPCILLCLDFHAVLREGQIHSMKITPILKCHLLQISLLALQMLADIVLQAFATPKPSHRTATWYSVIHRPKSHVSSCPLSSGITLYTTLGSA